MAPTKKAELIARRDALQDRMELVLSDLMDFDNPAYLAHEEDKRKTAFGRAALNALLADPSAPIPTAQNEDVAAEMRRLEGEYDALAAARGVLDADIKRIEAAEYRAHVARARQDNAQNTAAALVALRGVYVAHAAQTRVMESLRRAPDGSPTSVDVSPFVLWHPSNFDIYNPESNVCRIAREAVSDGVLPPDHPALVGINWNRELKRPTGPASLAR